MPSAWGSPPWRVGVAIPAAPVPRAVDVAIVGAGFAGLASAFALARRGAGVAVFEAGRIGAGASGHTGSIALEGTAVGPLEDADACLASLARVVDDAGIDCDLRLDGCWEITHRAEPGDLRRLWRDGETTLCIAGTVPGGTVDAGALLSGLARAALARGATIHEQQAVAGVEPGRLRLADGAAVAARKIVVAVNAYTPVLLRLPVGLRPVLTLALATVPLDDTTLAAVGLAERLPFYTIDLPYLWGRVLRDGRVVFGAGLVFPQGDDVRTTSVGDPEAEAAFARIETRIRGLHPALARVGIDTRWGGPIAFLPNRAPVLGHLPSSPDVVVTGGCAGHGVALSARIGELVADHLTTGRPLPSWGSLRALPEP